MKKIVFNSENGYAYDFVNGEMLELGKFCGIKQIHNTGIYYIGNDIYQLVNGKYHLLAENVEFHPISNLPTPNTKQFTTIKGILLFSNATTPDIIEINNVDAYKQIFFQQKTEQPVFAVRSRQNGSYTVFVRDTSDKIVKSCENAIGHGSTFFWSGAVWKFGHTGTMKTPIDLPIANSNYIIARSYEKVKDVFLITSEGNVSYLGNFKSIFRSPSSTILIVHEDNGLRLWNLTDRFIESIVFVNSDENFDISDSDGVITLHQKVDVGSDNGGIIDETVLYKLDNKQHYHRM